MIFLCKVAGCTIRDKVRSSVTWKELRLESQLLPIESSHLWRLGHLVPILPGRLPGEVPGIKRQDMLEGLCPLAGLGTP